MTVGWHPYGFRGIRHLLLSVLPVSGVRNRKLGIYSLYNPRYHSYVMPLERARPRWLPLLSLVLPACLVCGCGGGSSSGMISAPTITVSVSPSAASLKTGATQQFTATVTGTTNTAVTWSVNNVVGGNATVGTISASGLYTAPATVPNPNQVTVTAASEANPSSTGSATVNIVAPPPPVTMTPVDVRAGAETSGVNIALAPLTPTLQFLAVGTGNTAGATGVSVAQGGTANLFLVGNGFVPGTTYQVLGPAGDVTVTQPDASAFCTTTDGHPCVNVRIQVSPKAALGPHNILVENGAGEVTVFVGGLLITVPGQ